MATTGPESRLVARIRRELAQTFPGIWTVKIHGGPYQDAGIPDLFAILDGHLIAIEVKAQRPGESREHALGRVTTRQQATLDALSRAGATAGVALSVEDAVALVQSSSDLTLTQPPPV